MLLIDDLMLLPLKGLLGLAKRIQEAAEEEMVREKEAITGQLTDLYMMLETGEISEEEFERQETELLAQLDAIEEAEEEDKDETEDVEEEDKDEE